MSLGGGMGGDGHCHHGGNHGGGLIGHHADQSPSWNMAMQVEKDHDARLRIVDPRILVGITLFVFITLLSLPYTLDYLQNQRYANEEGVEESGSDSSGPSAGALAMVGATLMGGSVHLPENVLPSSPRSNSTNQNQISDDADETSDLSPEAAEKQVAKSASDEITGAQQLASKSAQDTVSQMLAASGMINSTAPNMVQPSAYVPPTTSPQYNVYIPNQQFGQPSAVPAAVIMPSHLQTCKQMTPSNQRHSFDMRSPFNPQTSAIVSPMGMRRHSAEPTVPMLSSTPGSDGSHRYRVFVSR